MKRIVICLVCLGLADCALSHRGKIQGMVRVIDGDTLAMGDERIRLAGIDAPERDQVCLRLDFKPWPCGRGAAQALAAYTAGREVVCHLVERDRYGRFVGECVLDGRSLSAVMVWDGWAVAAYEPSAEVVEAEFVARRFRRGVWSGFAALPAAWRRR